MLTLTENIQFCTGSNWLISSVGTNLALVDGLIRETGVIDLQVEHAALVSPEHGVPTEAWELPVVSQRQSILGPLNPPGQVPDDAVDDGPPSLPDEGVRGGRPEELLLGPGTVDQDWKENYHVDVVGGVLLINSKTAEASKAITKGALR